MRKDYGRDYWPRELYDWGSQPVITPSKGIYSFSKQLDRWRDYAVTEEELMDKLADLDLEVSKVLLKYCVSLDFLGKKVERLGRGRGTTTYWAEDAHLVLKVLYFGSKRDKWKLNDWRDPYSSMLGEILNTEHLEKFLLNQLGDHPALHNSIRWITSERMIQQMLHFDPFGVAIGSRRIAHHVSERLSHLLFWESQKMRSIAQKGWEFISEADVSSKSELSRFDKVRKDYLDQADYLESLADSVEEIISNNHKELFSSEPSNGHSTGTPAR